ncbi:hypothetical protein L9F63_007431, partial [Diploptera punctata]
ERIDVKFHSCSGRRVAGNYVTQKLSVSFTSCYLYYPLGEWDLELTKGQGRLLPGLDYLFQGYHSVTLCQ